MPALTAPLTRKQHHQAERRAYLTKHPNLKPREWDDNYPQGTRNHNWKTNLEHAAKTGVKLTRHVLDDAFEFNEVFGYHLLGIANRKHPGILPARYLPPQLRRTNRQRAA